MGRSVSLLETQERTTWWMVESRGDESARV